MITINKATLNKLYLIIIFLFIASETAFYVIHGLSGTVRLLYIIICTILILILSSLSKPKLHSFRVFVLLLSKTKLHSFIVFVLLLVIFIISAIKNNEFKQTTIIEICMISGFIFAWRIPFNKFVFYYRKILYFISIWSVVTFLCSLILPNLLSLFPTIVSNNSRAYYNVIFSVVSTDTYVMRNFGMFWEPGAYSIMLNIALFFELFIINNLNKKHLLALILAIITTLSTLGLGCMSLLIVAFLLKGNLINGKQKTAILFLFLVIASIFIIFGDYLIYHIFGKLSNEDNASTLTRTASVINMWEAFIQHPLLGVGYNKFLQIQEDECFNMATCSPLNWMAIYGIWGILFVYGIINFFIKFVSSNIVRCFMLIFALLLFSTENFIQIPFIYYLIFSGFHD